MSSYERDPITGILKLIDGMLPLSTIWAYIKERLGISNQGSTGKYLDEQGNFTTPPDTTYSVVSTTENGLAPKVTDTSKFLKGDGSWATPPDTNTTYTLSVSGNSLVLTPSSGTGNTITVPYATSANTANSATKAASLGRPQDAQAMTFNWAGQSGQPTWIFGGNDPGTSIYVYNPANFSVNYATSAGSCSKAMLYCFISSATVYCAPNQSSYGLGVTWGNSSGKQNFYCLRQAWPQATWDYGAVVSPAVHTKDDATGMKISFTSVAAQNYTMQAKFFYQLT